ncbi:MAG: hypothetical protein ACO32Y_11365 [Vulcanococcus sp.]
MQMRAVGHAAPLRGQRLTNLSHPARQWDEQAVQSTNQRIEGLAINALLVQLCQPELLTTGPAAKVHSGKGFAGGGDPGVTVSLQGPYVMVPAGGLGAQLSQEHHRSHL